MATVLVVIRVTLLGNLFGVYCLNVESTKDNVKEAWGVQIIQKLGIQVCKCNKRNMYPLYVSDNGECCHIEEWGYLWVLFSYSMGTCTCLDRNPNIPIILFLNPDGKQFLKTVHSWQIHPITFSFIGFTILLHRNMLFPKITNHRWRISEHTPQTNSFKWTIVKNIAPLLSSSSV